MFNVTLLESNNYLSLFLIFPIVVFLLTTLFFMRKKVAPRFNKWYYILIYTVFSAAISFIGLDMINSSLSSENIHKVEKELDIESFKVHNRSGELLCVQNSQTNITAVSWTSEGITKKEVNLGVMILEKDSGECKISIKTAGTR